MTKSSFIKNLIKPFLSNSTRDEHEVDLEKIAAQEQKHFPFQALVAATKNFDPSHKLGEGGFGPVFKGKLGDGREVAVKKLSQRSNQGKKEFLNEAKLLSRVQHKNVVNLFGYCVHDAENLLVYEYIANQSLDKLLFKPEGRVLLDWKRRHDVITGVAKGLLYLHEEAHCSIIHRDIKASNILLDDKWVPKIADFGMARLFPEDQTHVQTRIAGTNGYMAPEYLLHGKLSKKADVFSFGVVVLELISGQKNSTFDRDLDFESLVEWDENDEGPFCSSIPTTTTKVHCFLHFAQSTLLPRKAYKLYKKGRSLEIVDPAIASSADPEHIVMYIQIGLLCVQSDPQLRPAMDRVVVILSRKPSHLEEPTRPGVPGSRYRRHRTSTGSSRTANSGGSSSGSFGTTNTQTATLTGNTSSLTGPRLDPRGKRPVKD